MTGLGAIPFHPLAEIFPLLDGEALAALLPHIRCHSLFQVHGQHGTNCTFQKRSFLFEQQGVKRSHRMRAALALSGIFVSTVALAQNANTVTGSGVVIGRQGEILTNSHVTENCQSITVQISSGKMQPAILIARDEKNDLAVVLINPSSPAKVAAFRGGAPLRAGDSIVATAPPPDAINVYPSPPTLVASPEVSRAERRRTSSLRHRLTSLRSHPSSGPERRVRGALDIRWTRCAKFLRHGHLCCMFPPCGGGHWLIAWRLVRCRTECGIAGRNVECRAGKRPGRVAPGARLAAPAVISTSPPYFALCVQTSCVPRQLSFSTESDLHHAESMI